MLLVCGPCSAESFEQVYQTATAVKDVGVDYFRAGLWKPRTRPNGFEGVGERGVYWMKQIQQELNLKICTEVANPYMAETCLKNNFNAVWIGARTTQNPFVVEDIASCLDGSDVVVMVKNPLNPDIKLWLGAIERFEKHSITNIIAIHRGFSLTYNKYRQSPLWRIPLELKRRRHDIPVLCDPSHIAGHTDYVKEIATTAISTGFDGLMIETHIKPSDALTDSMQQLTVNQLKSLIQSLPQVISESKEDARLNSLRNQIDDIDNSIITALSERMSVSREIAKIKKQHNLAAFQSNRWEKVLTNILKEAAVNHLDINFVKELYEIIHQESIKEQNLIINKSNI
ncbi:MAG: bifunctional 3-deoxy-7-phosphoheptulonate synthase/chorismate mutase type II [Bacteroidales bacterium]|nr:bifunctional 3-deoxy-7-phosphoheptulonate synthase/chorismate mutase type II [Bacteroidales bacterium]